MSRVNQGETVLPHSKVLPSFRVVASPRCSLPELDHCVLSEGRAEADRNLLWLVLPR